jgi:predicted dehydrogenase
MSNGARVVYDASWHPRGQLTDWNCRWLLECSGGYLRVDRDRVTVCESADPHRVPGPDEEAEVPLARLERHDQAAVLSDFLDAVRAGRAAPTTAVDNLRSLEMVFAATESADTGRAVAISCEYPGHGLPAR